MSVRSRRIARLRDITDRQEQTARFGMVNAEIAVRQAELKKREARIRTTEALRSTVHQGLRGALYDASVRSDARHDQQIESSQQLLGSETKVWETARQRAGSITKLSERINDRERIAAERAAERDLGDVISSRFGIRANTRTAT